MYGHSYGGFTAGETMFHDRRIAASINLDGTMGYGQDGEPPVFVSGEVSTNGLDQPFLLMGAEAVDPETGEVSPHTHLTFDTSWVEFWANQRGWKRDLLLETGAHLSYTDLQVILPQIAGPLNLPTEQIEFQIGTIDPVHSVTAQRTYIAGFFDLHLRNRDTGLFDGPSPQHPDITFTD